MGQHPILDFLADSSDKDLYMRSSWKDSLDGDRSVIAFFLTILNLFLFFLLLVRGSQQGLVAILIALFSLFVCGLLFLFSLGLSISGLRRRESLAPVSLFLNLISIAAVIFFSVIYPRIDTPERQARREQRLREQRRELALSRDNGGISLNENSFLFQLVNKPWWTPSFLVLFCGAGTIYLVRRRAARNLPQESQPSPAPAEPLQARCPKCSSEVSSVLANGGSLCPQCGATLVATRLPRETRGPTLSDHLPQGSSISRIITLLAIVLFSLLSLLWLGLLLAGQWATSKTVALLILLFFLALGLFSFALRERGL